MLSCGRRNRYLQIANVVPRIPDIDKVREQLREIAPKIRYAVWHGQMAPIALEGVMTAFDECAGDYCCRRTSSSRDSTPGRRSSDPIGSVAAASQRAVSRSISGVRVSRTFA
jgi:hypothetical protein